ncbi:MAG: SMC-Scp complex subunit ScpB [Planctomycetia bacterium]|nr:SMC-Scp complex subunit ScpB [Planctomycetia bacterium]
MVAEISFEELGQAFARVMRGGGAENVTNSPSTSSEEAGFVPEVDENGEVTEDEESLLSVYEDSPDPFAFMAANPYSTEIADDGVVPVSPLSVLEAMLFVGNPQNRPLRAEIASDLMRGVEVAEVHGLAQELNERYTREHCPWEVAFVEDGYVLRLREELRSLREVFYGKIRQAKLSQSAIDVLAIIAYEQPLTLEEISELRGVNCAPILGQLVRRNLLRVQRVRRGGKMVSEYYTTERFLKLFELDSLGDLPQSENLDRE